MRERSEQRSNDVSEGRDAALPWDVTASSRRRALRVVNATGPGPTEVRWGPPPSDTPPVDRRRRQNEATEVDPSVLKTALGRLVTNRGWYERRVARGLATDHPIPLSRSAVDKPTLSRVPTPRQRRAT